MSVWMVTGEEDPNSCTSAWCRSTAERFSEVANILIFDSAAVTAHHLSKVDDLDR